jgi:hypothetical protein
MFGGKRSGLPVLHNLFCLFMGEAVMGSGKSLTLKVQRARHEKESRIDRLGILSGGDAKGMLQAQGHPSQQGLA